MKTTVIGYLRVSTDDQATNGYGLAAQRAAIQAEADRRGWHVEWVADEGVSGKAMAKRPGLRGALERLGKRRPHRTVHGLVVAKLDRLTRSLKDFAQIMHQAHAEQWALVALDLNVDTTTPAGELLASVMAAVNQFERRVIGQRTRDALAVLKRRGVKLGNPTLARTSERIRARILRMRARGLGYAPIARTLNAEHVPTAQGGKAWHAMTVRKVATR